MKNLFMFLGYFVLSLAIFTPALAGLCYQVAMLFGLAKPFSTLLALASGAAGLAYSCKLAYDVADHLNEEEEKNEKNEKSEKKNKEKK